eukprot:COSAG01_NODE_801_length_13466_cov_585.329693_10_plen_242_part_00
MQISVRRDHGVINVTHASVSRQAHARRRESSVTQGKSGRQAGVGTSCGSAREAAAGVWPWWHPCRRCPRRSACPGRSRPQFRDQNMGDIGKSQSMWTDPKMENARLTPRSPRSCRRTVGVRQPQQPPKTLRRSQTHTDAVGAGYKKKKKKRRGKVGKRRGIAEGHRCRESHIVPAHLVPDHHDARELHLRAQDLLHAVQHPHDVAGVVLRRLRRQRLPPGAAQAALMRRPAAGGAQRRAGG